MSSFGMGSGSPYIDGDAIQELEILRSRLKSLQDEVKDDRVDRFLEAARRSMDRAMREIVDRNMDDAARFQMMLSRLNIPDEVLEKIYRRTEDG